MIKFIASVLVYPYKFKAFGRGSKIISPLELTGMKGIRIGVNVLILHQVWLRCAKLQKEKEEPKLCIGDGSRIGHFNTISVCSKVLLEKNVLTADNVFITDHIHSYENVNIPIRDLGVELKTSTVVIGEGSWLGKNVCVIGASIGKHCVIGANSVVTQDIPDYSVAVGSPAKVIKKFNFENNRWERI